MIPTPERLPCYRGEILEKGSYAITMEVEGKLGELSRFNTGVAMRATDKTNPVFPTRDDKTRMRVACNLWIGYWCANHVYINELKTMYLPPLPNTPRDELNSKGLRRIVTCTGSIFISEISRLWFLSKLDNNDENWKLDDTISGLWAEEWPYLETEPRSLELPSVAMEQMRADNEAKRRKQESDGSSSQNTGEIKIAPDVLFKNALNAFVPAEPTFVPISQVLRDAKRRASLLWYRPVCDYTMRNLYDSVMLLTERIDDYPYNDEIISLIEHLLARLGTFYLQPQTHLIMDMERYRTLIGGIASGAPIGGINENVNGGASRAPTECINEDTSDGAGGAIYRFNRDFQMWSTAYFFELIQRCHYWRYMSRERIERPRGFVLAQAETLKNIVVKLCEEMGRDEFFKLYRVCTEQQYDFPGDAMYSAYIHSGVDGGVVNRGDLLLKLRPERQAAKFFTEQNLDVASILNSICMGETHLARLCVFNIIDRFLFLAAGTKFIDNTVIFQRALEQNMPRIVENTIPSILHIFSRPCVHYELRVFCSDNIYEIIVVWLLLLRQHKRGMLFHTDISQQIRELLGEDHRLINHETNTTTIASPVIPPQPSTIGRILVELM